MLNSGELLFVEANLAYRRDQLARDFRPGTLRAGRAWVSRLGKVLPGRHRTAGHIPRVAAAPHH